MTMSTVRVFVNAKGHDVPAGASTLDAVRVANASEADAIAAGTRLVTDSRGLPVPNETPVYAGAIYRTVANRERSAGGGE